MEDKDNRLKKIKRFEPLWGAWYATDYLGGGSFGSVYKVRHMLDEKDYSAVKLLPFPSSQKDARDLEKKGYSREAIQDHYRKAVMNEIKIMRSLQGISNIVDIKDYNIIEREEEYGYDVLIRMEYLQCFTDYYLKNSWDEEKVIKFGIDLCIALEFMEKKNYVHRDIKPDNIFVNDLGLFKLGDFGEAKRIDSTVRSKHGTPRYMAPEVMRFGQYRDSRVDIYSLGMILYELCNDKTLPFYPAFPEIPSYDEEAEAIQRRCDGEEFPRPVHGGDSLVRVIRKACAYDIEDRFANATRFKDALRMCLAGQEPVMTSAENEKKEKETKTGGAPDLSATVPEGEGFPEAPAGPSRTMVAADIKNPVIERDGDMKSGQNVEWDLVEFGSYPQREIHTYDEIYQTLVTSRAWNYDNTINLEGTRYLRCKKVDASYVPDHRYLDKEDAMKNGWYYWNDEDIYHYFQVEPIQWRVLHTEERQTLLLADQILDAKTFDSGVNPGDRWGTYPPAKAVGWEESQLKGFLNETFYQTAFSDEDRQAILPQEEGDRVSLMGIHEISGQYPGAERGFLIQADTDDEGRRSKSSDYAKAMGLSFNQNMESNWWLKDPGEEKGYVSCVLDGGYILKDGLPANSGDTGVRPVILVDPQTAQFIGVSKITSKEK